MSAQYSPSPYPYLPPTTPPTPPTTHLDSAAIVEAGENDIKLWVDSLHPSTLDDIVALSRCPYPHPSPNAKASRKARRLMPRPDAFPAYPAPDLVTTSSGASKRDMNMAPVGSVDSLPGIHTPLAAFIGESCEESPSSSR